MRFLSFIASAIAAFATVATAQVNPFSYPVHGETLNAGTVVVLKWTPTTPGTVSLVLRSGNSNALSSGTPITSNIPNSGNYAWSIPSSTVNLFGYTVEIVSDSNENLFNYTPAFTVTGGATASASGSSAMSTAMSTSTGTAMSSMSNSMTMTGASTMSTSASATADATTSAVEAAGTVMAGDSNEAGGCRAKSGFAAVAALVGVIAMI